MLELFQNEESFMAALDGLPDAGACCAAHKADHARIAALIAGVAAPPEHRRVEDLAHALGAAVCRWQEEHIACHDAVLLAMLAHRQPTQDELCW